MKYCIFIFSLFMVSNLYADQPIELFQITCIKDMRYFELDSKSYSEASNYLYSDTGELDDKIKLLNSNGLYLPENLSYECSVKNMERASNPEHQKLASNTLEKMKKLGDRVPASMINRLKESLNEYVIYKVVANKGAPKATGMCGGSPTASLSLWRNNILWIDDVLVNEGCNNRPSITKIIINEGRKGWSTTNMTICMKKNYSSNEECSYMSETYSDIKKRIPINNKNLINLIKK